MLFMGFCCLGITEKSYTANRSCLTSKEQNATTENGAVKRSSQSPSPGFRVKNRQMVT